MEDPPQMTTAELRPSKALTPPDGKSMVSTQQENPPDASVANPVTAAPSTVSRKTPMGKGFPQRFIRGLRNCMRSFINGWRKLGILLWKNLLLRIRSWILLGCQIFFALYFVGSTLNSGPMANDLITHPATPAETISETEMIEKFTSRFAGKDMIYVPAKQGDPPPSASAILNEINRKFTTQTGITWTPVPKESDVESEFNLMYAQKRNNEFEGAIIFEEIRDDLVKYKIRMAKDKGIDQRANAYSSFQKVFVHSRTDILFASTNPPGPNEVHRIAYNEAGILGLQLLIDDSAVKVLLRTVGTPSGFNQHVKLNSFPYPEYKEVSDETSKAFAEFSIGLLLVFVFSNAFLVRSIGSEKETGVKELMKMCGYPGWMQWLAWYLIQLVVESFLFVIIIAVLKCIPIRGKSGNQVIYLEKSSATLWFVVLVLTEISNDAFVIFISSFIKSTTVATSIVIILTFFGGLAVGITLTAVKKQTFWLYMGFTFYPHGCFLVALKFLFFFEQLESGATWSVLDRQLPNIPDLNLGYVMLMFLLDFVMYHIVAVYLEAILPSNYGMRKPMYYPIVAICRPIINFIPKRKKGVYTGKPTSPVQASESKATGFEPYQGPSTTIGVDVQNLVKKFDRNKVAVGGVNVKMYDGEIFALLGHNGAGKTTLISMLTGMFAPTSGTARVGGHDITTDMNGVRQSLGLCPQHDMLFKNLTVMEHLTIFGAMKGKSCASVKKEAKSLLTMMRMADKAGVASKKLSGGQKRKLCLGMALIGEAKVVILDEPTSGMDPEARRAIWDILLQIRGQRTILLTTHHMEEADILGDRIGIMAEGKLQCCGSPAFLKQFYGTGYTLKASLFTGADKYAILSLVQKHISDASFKPINMPTEVFISLPTETASPTALASLFSELTTRKQEMHIESLGLSVASMDEIFVKVGELSEKAAVEEHMADLLKSTSNVRSQDHDHSHDQQKKKKHTKTDHGPDTEVVVEAPSIVTEATPEGSVHPAVAGASKSGVPPTTKATTQTLVRSRRRALFLFGLVFIQAWAILVKRFIITRRKIGFLIFQLIFPSLCMLGIALGARDTYKPAPLPPPLHMSLEKYKNPVIYHSDDQSWKDKAKNAIGSSVEFTANVAEALKKTGESDINSFRDNYIAAGEIAGNEYIAWFNTLPLHAAPLALNLASNIRGADLSSPIKFQVTHYPLQTKDALIIQAALEMDTVAFAIAMLLSVPMILPLSAIAVCFINLPAEERLNKSRQLQLMTGMHPFNYWVVNLIWDLVIVLVATTFMIAIAALCESYEVFSSYHGLGVIFLVLLLYGYAVVPLAYMFSNVTKTVSGGVILLLLYIFVPFFFALPLVLLEPEAFGWWARFFPILGTSLSLFFTGLTIGKNAKCGFVKALTDAGKNILCSNPSTATATSATTTTTSSTSSFGGNNIQGLRGCCSNCRKLVGVTCFKPDAFITWDRPGAFHGTFPGIGQIMGCLLMISLFCQVVHFIIQLGLLDFFRRLMIRATPSDFVDNVMDEDVQLEKQRVAQMIATKQTGQDAFVVTNISKNYCTLAAVSKLTFGVHHGECFGLLGTNGAGKTTTFRIITGDEVQSLGDAFEGVFSLSRNRRKLISNIGYCPQFDAFIPYLTGKENVQMFARLRGVPWGKVNVLVDQLLARVGLTDSRNVLCRKYSGGMKRRLSAAIALIGDPSVLLLDEPTSGVDPVSRRQFWKILESVKASGKSIILTSHSMDECEALCSRLGIMVNGELQCIGGVQHLKHKFAQGYCLTLRLKPSPMSDLQSPFQQTPQAQQPQFKQLQNPFPQQQQFQQPQLQQFQQQQQQFQPQQQQFQQQPPQFQQQSQQFQPQQQQFQRQQQQFQPQQQQYQQPQQQSQFQFQQPPQQQFQFQQQNAMAGQLEGLNKEITEKFHPCVLKDQHETVLQYQIENTALGWDVIYKTLEDLKKSYADIIEDYSVSETSLEEVFLAFSRRQYPPRTAKVPSWKRVLTCQC